MCLINLFSKHDWQRTILYRHQHQLHCQQRICQVMHHRWPVKNEKSKKIIIFTKSNLKYIQMGSFRIQRS